MTVGLFGEMETRSFLERGGLPTAAAGFMGLMPAPSLAMDRFGSTFSVTAAMVVKLLY